MKNKSLRRKSHTKRRRGRLEDNPNTGSATPGETFDPMAIPEERESDETFHRQPRPAPAPGVPVSHEEYERLKQRAKTIRKRSTKHVQEDPSGKN